MAESTDGIFWLETAPDEAWRANEEWHLDHGL